MADSFTAPGNSENYINPDDSNDTTIDSGDWLQGAPGKNNASSVRDALDLLLGELNYNQFKGQTVCVSCLVHLTEQIHFLVCINIFAHGTF